MDEVDAVIVGAGPAGLSAALGLARCMRRLAIFDDGVARNDVARAIHGYLTRDGAKPQELKRVAREELRAYGVEVRHDHIENAKRVRTKRGRTLFEVLTSAGVRVRGRKLVLATGLEDTLPDVENFAQFYGTSIWHCPHCDGYEARGKKLAVLGHRRSGVELALSLRVFSDDVILLTNGTGLDARRREQCRLHELPWIDDELLRFEGADGRLERVVFKTANAIERDGLFFHLGAHQRSPLPKQLGCEFNRHGAVKRANRGEESTAPGVYVVGDASEDARLIVVAAAEGAKAAVHIHKRLREEDMLLIEGR